MEIQFIKELLVPTLGHLQIASSRHAIFGLFLAPPFFVYEM